MVYAKNVNGYDQSFPEPEFLTIYEEMALKMEVFSRFWKILREVQIDHNWYAKPDLPKIFGD